MQLTLSRMVSFHARHRYFRPEWSDEENRARFGWTADAPGHGHLYQVTVTVAGPLDQQTAMLIDLTLLDTILAEEVEGPLAGQSLNEAIPAVRTGEILPSCEAVAAWCWSRVAPRIPHPARLTRVRVAEDVTLWADCHGPQTRATETE